MLYATQPTHEDVIHALKEAERRNAADWDVETIVFALGPKARIRRVGLILDKILINRFTDQEFDEIKSLLPPTFH